MVTTKNLETLEERATLADYKGKWLILFFWPFDFTFVCPTEVTSFSDSIAEFEDLDCEVLGVSVDSVHTHRAWIRTPRDQQGIGEVNFPLASDITKRLRKLTAFWMKRPVPLTADCLSSIRKAFSAIRLLPT